MTQPFSIPQLEELKRELEAKKTQKAIAEARCKEIEDKLQKEFGLTIQQVPDAIKQLETQCTALYAEIQTESAEFEKMRLAAGSI